MHPFAAAGKRLSRWSAKYPCQRHERNEQRAVGNAGSYAVRHCRAEHGSGSGERSGGDPLWAFLRRITFGVKEFQRPWVFGGVFASFCRRGQKDVAPEREISLPEA